MRRNARYDALAALSKNAWRRMAKEQAANNAAIARYHGHCKIAAHSEIAFQLIVMRQPFLITRLDRYIGQTYYGLAFERAREHWCRPRIIEVFEQRRVGPRHIIERNQL